MQRLYPGGSHHAPAQSGKRARGECEWKRGDGQPKRPNSRDSGHHGGLDEVAFSWTLS
jgi:hypothetical protein